MSPSQGQGKGDMQLPDIIMSQEELNKQMEEGLEKKEGEKEGEKKGDKEGGKPKEGDSKSQKKGEGSPSNEELNGELMEIYQKQQKLREQLEKKVGKKGKDGVGGDLLNKMEEVELDLINKGFTNKTLQKMMELQHQLLKLENATFQQGEDQKRKSETNTKEFSNTTNNQPPNAQKYFNTTEILNRKALPLNLEYQKKVQEYFKQKND